MEELLKLDLMTLLLERLENDYDSGPICSLILATVGTLLERSEDAKQIFFRLEGNLILEVLQISPSVQI